MEENYPLEVIKSDKIQKCNIEVQIKEKKEKKKTKTKFCSK